MIDTDLINNKVIESLVLLTGVSVGDILSKIGEEENLDPLIILAFEEFYDKYSKIVLEIDDGQTPDDLEILEQCLQESVIILERAKTDEERAIATVDVMDLRRTIRRLKKGEKPSGSK